MELLGTATLGDREVGVARLLLQLVISLLHLGDYLRVELVLLRRPVQVLRRRVSTEF